MTKTLMVLPLTLSIAVLALTGLAKIARSPYASHAAERGVLLTGTAKSASGEKMRGVTVSAKIDGQAITTSVFTDDQGAYYFPPMTDGKYRIRAQAVGYQKAQGDVDLKGTVQHHDFVMKETKDFVLQLSGDHMVAALPEDTPARRRMKDVFIRVCTECHAGNVALQNRFDADGWEAILISMSRIGALGTFGERVSPVISHFQKDLVAYLSEMRGPGPSPMQFTLPSRPVGDAALPVVYEYDLPAEAGGGYVLNNGSDWSVGASSGAGGSLGLHDATVDFNGNIWFTWNDQGSINRTLGKLDTTTGKVTDFKYPGHSGRAANSHGIYTAKDGTIWFNVNTRAAGGEGAEKLGKIDPKAEKLEVFTPPRGMRGMSIHVDEDGQGYIWGDNATGAVRFDPKTREFREFKSLKQPGSTYGATGDRDGNGWWTQIGIDMIGHSNLKTGKVLEIKVPSGRHPFLQEGDLSAEDLKAYGTNRGQQAPRRPEADTRGDHVWIPNYAGNNLMGINIRTLKTTMYPAPRVGLNPYMAAVDDSHNVWVSLQGGDEVAQFEPTSEKWTLYSWPSRGTGLRNLGLLDHEGVVQVVGAYYNANRVGRMVMRTGRELQALKTRVQAN